MCIEPRQPLSITYCEIGVDESTRSETLYPERSFSPVPQHSPLQEEDYKLSQINHVEETIRSRSHCFFGLLEIGNSSSESLDQLSNRFSRLSSGRKRSESTSEPTSPIDTDYHDNDNDNDSSPRKRQCRGLVRSQRSSHLLSLVSLSDEDSSLSF